MTRDTKETVALILAGVIGLFVLTSLLVVFVLAREGHPMGDAWTSLFGLVVAIMSALGGWLAGTNGLGTKTPIQKQEE